jgi:hypothetical protein
MWPVPVAHRYEQLRHSPYLNVLEMHVEAEHKRGQIKFVYTKNGAINISGTSSVLNNFLEFCRHDILLQIT